MEQTLRTEEARPLWLPTRVRAPRRLGTELAVPRRLMLIYFPCIMLATALVTWLSPTDFMLMIGSLVLSALALYLLYDLIVGGGPFRFSLLLVFALSFGYGLGTANTYFSLDRGGMDLAVFLRRDPVVITRGMAGVLGSLGIALALGELLEKPVFGEDFELLFPPQTGLFLVACTMVLLVGFKTGAIGFMGAETGEQSQVSVFTSFVSWIITPTFGLTLVAGLNAATKLGRRALLALTGLQFLLIVPTGRRRQLFAILIAIFCMRLGRYRLRWSLQRKIIVGVILTGMLYLFTIVFFYLRLASAGRTSTGVVVSLPERLSAAWTYFQNTNFADVQEAYSKNVKGRTFVLAFLAELEDYSTRYTPGYGQDIWLQFREAIPSVLDPNKIRGWNEEGFANTLFGSTYWDEANSVLTAGAIDFSFLGMVLYPLMFAFLFRGMAELWGELLPTFVACFLIVQSISAAIEPEQDPINYFVAIRNGMLFFGFVWLLMSLPLFRLRRAT